MARWTTRRVDVAANTNPDGGGDMQDAADTLLKGGDKLLGLIIAVPESATHAVLVSLDDEAASAGHYTFRIEPGGNVDTTALPPQMQPGAPVTAWTGPDLTAAGPPLPGALTLDLTTVYPS